MALPRQAKTLNKSQVEAVLSFLAGRRNGGRNQVIFMLSAKAGLRAKEIAGLKWEMVLDSDGSLSDSISLSDDATKGRSGRKVPLNKALRIGLSGLLEEQKRHRNFDPSNHVVRTERAGATSAQVIVNMFRAWYRHLGLVGCSSHSGRRTFITNAAKKISTVGGSLRDVQYLAGHSSLQTTERYIEQNATARKRIVDLV